jgi:cobalt-zinc-cadmium efflux system outer membrane protein
MIRFVLGAMACVAVAHADTLTLVDALQRVAQNHPLARALALELEATRWYGRAERALAPMSVYLAPMLSDGGSGEELIVQQPLELNGGQRARAALSHARYQLHRAEAQRALNDLLTQTAEAFVDAYAYQRRLEAVAHYVQTLDALQPQVAVHAPRETAQAQAMEVGKAHRRALYRLNALLQRPLDAPLRLLPVQELPDMPTADDAVDADAAQLALLQAELRLMRAQLLPDVVFQARVEKFAGNATRPAYALVLEFPLIDYGARRAEIRAQQLLIQAQELRMEAARLQAQAEQRTAEDAYRAARAQLTQAQQRVERLTAARAQTVANDASTLLEHATELWRARMELIDAEHRALRAWVAWKSIDEAFLKEVKAYATRP